MFAGNDDQRRPVPEWISRLMALDASARAGLLLVVCAAVALTWSNSPYTASYTRLWQTPLVVGVGDAVLNKPLLLWVNAGIMASSRYPLAMARDGLMPGFFARLTGRGTPAAGIIVTSGLMLAFIFFFDISSVAKLASAFGLLIFGLLNVAVIVMRESRIDYYRPGYRSPFYPWMQIVGVIVSVWLIIEMGWIAVLFTAGVSALCVGWYFAYGRKRAKRDGAIFHVFERLGRRVYRGLDHELRTIVAEKGLDVEDPFEEVVTQSDVLDLDESLTLRRAVAQVVDCARHRSPGLDVNATIERIMEEARIGLLPTTREAAIAHLQSPDIKRTRLVILRSRPGIERSEKVQGKAGGPLMAFMLLLSPEGEPSAHLRILAQLAGHVEDEGFGASWMSCRTEVELKEVLLRDEHFVHLSLAPGTPTGALVGRQVCEIGLPEGALVALVQRKGMAIVPGGRTVLQAGDRLTLIGSPQAIERLSASYSHPESPIAEAAREADQSWLEDSHEPRRDVQPSITLKKRSFAMRTERDMIPRESSDDVYDDKMPFGLVAVSVFALLSLAAAIVKMMVQ